jgi:uncharacterized protein
MQIWVDADACPRPIKETLFRAAARTQIVVTLVANKLLHVPLSPYIKAVQVPGGFDVADDEIIRRAVAGDLAVTADIPLAAQLVAKRVHTLSPRGEVFSAENIEAALAMRNFMEQMRESGVVTGGPDAFSQADAHAFARQLDKLLTAFLQR